MEEHHDGAPRFDGAAPIKAPRPDSRGESCFTSGTRSIELRFYLSLIELIFSVAPALLIQGREGSQRGITTRPNLDLLLPPKKKCLGLADYRNCHAWLGSGAW